MAGIYLLDKQSGPSSARALAQLKAKLKIKKIGHAGTLDPFASGLLVCLTGAATRLANFAQSGEKAYTGELEFGSCTDTDDITGKVLEQVNIFPDLVQARSAALELTGEIFQEPPQYSALKLAGMRAYALARRGEQVKLTARKVKVNSFDLTQIDYRSYTFYIRCATGTYVRALVRDLGRKLDSAAFVKSLRRVESFPYALAQAKSLESITLEDQLSPVTLFPHVPCKEVSPAFSKKMLQGNLSALNDFVQTFGPIESDRLLYRDADRVLGLIVRNAGIWNYAVNIG